MLLQELPELKLKSVRNCLKDSSSRFLLRVYSRSLFQDWLWPQDRRGLATRQKRFGHKTEEVWPQDRRGLATRQKRFGHKTEEVWNQGFPSPRLALATRQKRFGIRGFLPQDWLWPQDRRGLESGFSFPKIGFGHKTEEVWNQGFPSPRLALATRQDRRGFGHKTEEVWNQGFPSPRLALATRQKRFGIRGFLPQDWLWPQDRRGLESGFSFPKIGFGHKTEEVWNQGFPSPRLALATRQKRFGIRGFLPQDWLWPQDRRGLESGVSFPKIGFGHKTEEVCNQGFPSPRSVTNQG